MPNNAEARVPRQIPDDALDERHRLPWYRDKVCLQILILSGALILAETIFFQKTMYVYSGVVHLLVSIGVFFSISVGSMLGVFDRFRFLDDDWMPPIASFFFSVAVLGIIHATEWGVVWVVFSFIGYGMFLARAFAFLSLKRLIVAIALGSVFMYGSLIPLYGLAGQKIIFMACALPLCAVLPALMLPSARGRRWLFSVVLALFAALALVQVVGGFKTISYIERDAPGLQNAQRVMETHYSPLILTDLVWAPRDNSYYILTNGSRFSAIMGPEDFPKSESLEPFIPTFDPPYLFVKPKKVLIIGPGGGANVRTALKWRIPEVVGVDINPQVFEIMAGPMRGTSLDMYFDPRFRRVVDEGRHFLETTKETFDLIVLQGVQTGSANNILNTAVLEGFLFTQESLKRMWNILNPGGMIFIEEYVFYHDDKSRDFTLLDNLARQLTDIIDKSDAEKHVFQVRFRQSVNNPNSSQAGRKWREALLASKDPIFNGRQVIENAFKNVETKTWSRESPNWLDVTDNAPFFIKKELTRYKSHLLIVAVVFFALVMLFARLKGKTKDLAFGFQSMVFQGGGFICMVMTVLGPATLLIGPPQLTTPIVYFTLFLFSMLGGLFALSRSRFPCSRSYGPILVYLTLLPVSYLMLKAFFLPLDSVVLRALPVAAVIGIAALLVEIPYILLLNRFHGSDRAWLFVFGKIGIFAGVPLGILSQLEFGFAGCLTAALLFYLSAFMVERHLLRLS